MIPVGLVLLAPPSFFMRRSGVVATLFRRNLSLLRLHGPSARPMCSRHLLALIPRSCRGRVIMRSRFCLGRRFGLVKVRLGDHGPRTPTGCGNRVDGSFRSVSRLGERGDGFGCTFLDPVFSDVSGSYCATGFSVRALRRTSSRNIVSGQMVTLNKVADSGVRRIESLKFKKIIVLNSL